MPDDDEILVEKSEGIGTITLNRPHRLNALSSHMLHELLPRIWQDLAEDEGVKVVIFTGAGDRGFCSGMDVKEAAASKDWGRPRDGEDEGSGSKLTARHHNFPKPVIAAVNGICSGGGLMFVSDADIAIASENASFFNPGVMVGQLAGYAPVTWTRWVPFQSLMRMTLVGGKERIGAVEAKGLGIVTEVVPQGHLISRAKEVATWIADASPTAVRLAKRMLWEALAQDLEDAHLNGHKIMTEYRGHPDMLEGPRAFAEKRKPNWAKD